MGWPYQQKPPMGWPLDYDSGLVPTAGWWLMPEGSGNKIFDLSGNGNTGTFVGDTLWTPGKFGSCLSFDGTGDYSQANSTLSASTEKMTALLWYKTSASGGAVLEINNGSSVSYIAVLFYNDTSIRFYHKLLSDPLSAITVPSSYIDGNWHMLAVITDGVRPHIYLDGIKYLGDAATGTMDLSGLTNIGASPIFGDYHNGLIDNVMIYDRALSASEIALLYRYPFCMFKDPAEIALLGGYQVTPSVTGIMTTNTGYWGSI